MTVTTAAPAPPAPDLLAVTVDGRPVEVPKGTLIIRAAEAVGIAIPRFCDHPLLAPAANCRMCLIEIEGMPKPQPACAVTVSDGMVVKTAQTSEVARLAQRGTMEFLLINHPLDCPICDKGGECPLQNQAMTAGRGETRFRGPKRTFVKPIPVSAQILLDRERCISCARCTRFADEIAGDPFLALTERGSAQQIATGLDQPFDSYFSGNVVQICPVGALTSMRYRFRSRPFDLVSTPTVCEHCSGGCATRTDVRRSAVLRRQAGDDPDVNEEWICDKGRFGFAYLSEDRIGSPLVRDEETGELVPASWPEALSVAAAGLAAAGSRSAVLTGGRLTYEDSYAYAKFARLVLGTDAVDFRARPSSAEEAQFLAAIVAGRPLGPTYADLEAAPAVVLAGLEPEDEAAAVFLRLRKASRRGTRVYAVAPLVTRGLVKLAGALLPTVPGHEAIVLDALARDAGSADGDAVARAAADLRSPGAVLLVGERLATVPGALSAAARLADATGARLGWVPRRAGDRGAVDAGALPGLLPGGRPLTDPDARSQVAQVWGVEPDRLPTEPGRSLTEAADAVAADVAAREAASNPATVQRSLQALVVAGVEPRDLADPAGFLQALQEIPFLVSFEQRRSEVTDRADVVFPVALVTERPGSYVDWEGRHRPFGTAIAGTVTLTDGRALALLADELDVPFGDGTPQTLSSELAALGAWRGERTAAPSVAADEPTAVEGGFVVAAWRQLLDDAALQVGEPHLAATARPVVARVCAAAARELGPAVSIAGRTYPVEAADMPDGVVWIPASPVDPSVPAAGTVVSLTPIAESVVIGHDSVLEGPITTDSAGGEA